MTHVQWKLHDYLKSRGITPYRLAKAIPEVRQATIYRLAAQDAPQAVSFGVLSQVIHGLRKLTGQDITPNDLILVVEEPEPQHGVDPHRTALSGTVQKLKQRGSPPALKRPTNMAAIIAEMRGKNEQP